MWTVLGQPLCCLSTAVQSMRCLADLKQQQQVRCLRRCTTPSLLLPRFRPAAPPSSLYIPQAWYKTSPGPGLFKTTIFLPPGASQEPVVLGDYQTQKKWAKNAAALAAIKQIWREGKMTGCLFPTWRSNFHAQQLGEAPLPCQNCSSICIVQAALLPQAASSVQQAMVQQAC